MAKFKVLWLSRHELTNEQRTDLQNGIIPSNVDELEVNTVNVTWQNSNSKLYDKKLNVALWENLLTKYAPDVVLGVFPPVALEAAKLFRPNLALFSPISEQNATMREDGTRQIEFVHLRWSDNLNE